MIIGRQLVERVYSENDYTELEDLIERAFCEGYEYAQREFNMKSVGATLKNNVRLAQEATRGTKYAGKSMASVSRLITSDVKNSIYLKNNF